MVDWHSSYNVALVRRGQILLDFDVVDKRDHELYQMNLGKVGEPYYYYSDSFIQLLGYMKVSIFHLPYRQTQGVVIAHADNKVSTTPPHYRP